MPALKKIFIYFLCSTMSLLLFGRTSISEMSISEQTLPEDTIVEELYQPGSGLPVGKIQSVRGNVVIFHLNPAVGYLAKTGLPVYQGDTIRTPQDARIICRLIDGSKFTLKPQTKLSILRCNYSSAGRIGESFLSLKQGGARFQAKRPTELSSYDFKVQTETVFAVTKDADFIVKAGIDATEIITFDDSRLEVTGMADPEGVIFLSAFQRIIVEDKLDSPTVESVSQEEVEALTTEFRLLPESKLFASSAERYRSNDMTGITLDEEGNP